LAQLKILNSSFTQKKNNKNKGKAKKKKMKKIRPDLLQAIEFISILQFVTFFGFLD